MGEYRPSQGQPTKSAITGLLAAALGIDREDDAEQLKLTRNYGVATCVLASGELLRDYHTAQVPTGNKKYITRREELLSDTPTLNTILSRRDYRTDAFYKIAVWVVSSNPPYTLDKLGCALRQPKFSLYLGRKSCPVSLPLSPEIISDVTLKQAFDKYTIQEAVFRVGELGASELTSYYWEQNGLKTGEAGMSSSMIYPRRDQILSRKRWQFAVRNEHYYAE